MNIRPIHSGVFASDCQYPVVRFFNSKEEKGSMTISNANKGFFCVSNSLIDEYGKKIGPNGIAIYLALRRFANRKDMSCFPAHKTIAGLIGCTDRNVINYIPVLIEQKLVIKEPRFESGKQLSNSYQLDKLQDRFFMVSCDTFDTHGPEIGAYAVAVYAAMARFSNSRDATCFPSYQVIADLIGAKRRGVINAVGILEKSNLVVKEVRVDESGCHNSNFYRVVGVGISARKGNREPNNDAGLAVGGSASGSPHLVHQVQGGSASGSGGVVHQVQGGGASGSDKPYSLNQTKFNHTHETRGPAEETAPSDSMCVGASLSSKSSSTSVGRETGLAGNVRERRAANNSGERYFEKRGGVTAAPLTENKEEGFKEFWELYPRKMDEEGARQVWVTLKPEDQKNALEGVVRYVNLFIRKKMEEKGFDLNRTIYAATWLSKKRWTDVYEASIEKLTPVVAIETRNNKKKLQDLEHKRRYKVSDIEGYEKLKEDPRESVRSTYVEFYHRKAIAELAEIDAEISELNRVSS